MAQLTIPNGLTVRPGQTVTIPINIDDATGLQSIDLIIDYDPTILDLASNAENNPDITIGDALTQINLGEPNVDDSAGRIILTGFGLNPLNTGFGTAINITFLVSPNTSGATTIDLVEAEINEGTIPVTLEDGNITIEDNNLFLTLEAGTAQIAYVAYYGRPADPGGVNFWNDVFERENIIYSPRGGRGINDLTEQELSIYSNIANDFGNSDEANRVFDGLTNRQKINQVYNFAFNRDGDSGGLDYWTNELDIGNVSLTTFALEVALGAQNEDFDTLQNKIESAELFSQGVETHPNGSDYVGPTGEIFGRDWLSDYGNTVATIDDVNNALNTLGS